MKKMIKITINDQPVEAQAGQTVLEAATAAGIKIPTLCHHPALEPIGACRVCLIEVSKFQPLYPACTYQVTEGLTVQTHSPRVEKARRFVLDLLFSERNHYCMYCESSGDCELQDLGYQYGLDHWVYPTYTKRFPVDASRDSFLMDHNRCILCRRCVRACAELVANHTLGERGRGAQTMINADMNLPFGESSCIACGTCLQVCPTGALLDKRSAFMGRSSQTERTPSTCSQCSLGCGLDIVARDGGILRVEGRWEAEPNCGLLCQMGRFDPLDDRRPRVVQPMVRRNGALVEVDWDEALQAAANQLGDTAVEKVGVLTTTNATNEALYLLSTLFRQELGVGHVGLLNSHVPLLSRPHGSLADLEACDLIVVAGANPVVDQPVASFLVKRTVDKGARLVVVDGEDNSLAPFAILHLPSSQVTEAVQVAARAEHPVVIYGTGLTPEAARALQTLEKATFIALEPGVNTRAAVALGLNHGFASKTIETLYLLLGEQAPDGQPELTGNPRQAFTIVQACYQSPLLEQADVVLPMAIWAERSGSLTNTEGRVQKANQAVDPQGKAKPDWQILGQLAEKLGVGVGGSLETLSPLATQYLNG